MKGVSPMTKFDRYIQLLELEVTMNDMLHYTEELVDDNPEEYNVEALKSLLGHIEKALECVPEARKIELDEEVANRIYSHWLLGNEKDAEKEYNAVYGGE